MKILFVTDLYPISENEKTTPKTLQNFVKGWKKLGHDVDIIKPNFLLNSFLRKKPFYKTGQYGDVYNVNYLLPFVGKLKPPSQDYELIIAHMPSGILFADKLGKPFIAGIHNSDIEILTKPIYKSYFKKRLLQALRNAKAIACRSFVIKKKLLDLYPEFAPKTFAAPSGVDIEIFKNTKNYPPVKILSVANYKKRKNIDKLIEAVKQVDGYELTVIGKGYMGWLEHEKVLEKMRESDIFILPSVGETFGMVYLEAMACGCITVCTKNDGIDGIIENGINGFTVEPNVKSIKELLLKIKNMKELQINTLRSNSLSTVKNYTSEKCCEKYLQEIEKIIR